MSSFNDENPQKAERRVLPRKEPFERAFQVGEELGKGGYGIVYSGTRRRDGLPVAVKYVSKDVITVWGRLNGCTVPLEICLLWQVSGIPGVIRIVEWYETMHSFVIIMERPELVKDLYDFIAEKCVLDDNISKLFFRQVVEIVIACHKAGVIHRDLKSENILVDLNTLQIKLIDFGCGDYLKDTVYTEYSGTDAFTPPEWIRHREYDGQSATVWSLGILLYVMVCGDVPFHTNNQILEAYVQFPSKVSPGCQDLIQKCLNICPTDRLTLEEILHHQWLTKKQITATPEKSASWVSEGNQGSMSCVYLVP